MIHDMTAYRLNVRIPKPLIIIYAPPFSDQELLVHFACLHASLGLLPSILLLLFLFGGAGRRRHDEYRYTVNRHLYLRPGAVFSLPARTSDMCH